jgi:tetratricopeptide (TPR) repeat protein
MLPYLRVLFILLIPALLVSCKSSKKVAKTDATKPETGILSKSDLDLIYHFHNATRDKLNGNYEQAVNAYKKCLSIDPNHHASAYELGILFINGGDPLAGESYARIAYKNDPDNYWYGLLMVESLKINRKNAEANKVYEKLIKQNPGREELYLDYSQSLASVKQFQAALDVLDKLEKQKGISYDVVAQKQKIYLRQNNLDKAVAEINRLIQSNPTDPKNILLLAETYSANNMPDKARKEYDRALSLDPDNPYINLSLAESYRVVKDYEGAMPYLMKAFSSAELSIDAKVKILLGFYLMSETSEQMKTNAYKLLDVTTETHANDAKAWSIYADFAYRDRNFSKARECFVKSIELDNSKYLLWNQLLILESEMNDYDSMVKHGLEAKELFPSEPTLYLLLGLAYLQKKNNEEAVNILKQGLAIVVDNDALEAQFQANLGDAYYRLKDYDKSDEAYETALRFNPNDSYVLNNYSYYLSLRKEKLERAAEMSKKSNELVPNNASYLDTYGWILYVKGDYTEAVKWLRKAVDKGGEKNAVILEHLGDALYKINQTDEAIKYWQQAKEAGEGTEFLERKLQERRLIE